MSNRYLSAAWTLSGLKPAQKLVLVRLADRANDSGKCWPGLDSIAVDCGLHRSTVIRHIEGLEDSGLLEIERQRGRGCSNQYRLRLELAPRENKRSQTATISDKTSHSAQKNVAFCNEKRRTVRPEPSGNPQGNRVCVNATPSDDGSDPSYDGSDAPQARRARVPHKKIVELYHQHCCPPLSEVYEITDARRTAMRARWADLLPDLEAWNAFFETVAESEFLRGDRPPTGNRKKPFKANFDWLLKPANAIKIIEGEYDD